MDFVYLCAWIGRVGGLVNRANVSSQSLLPFHAWYNELVQLSCLLLLQLVSLLVCLYQWECQRERERERERERVHARA